MNIQFNDGMTANRAANNKSGHKSICLYCHNLGCLPCRLWCGKMGKVWLVVKEMISLCLISCAMCVESPSAVNMQDRHWLSSTRAKFYVAVGMLKAFVEPLIVACEGNKF